MLRHRSAGARRGREARGGRNRGALVTHVLIAGAWHGAWCWDEVIPRLEAAGHRAVAIELPGTGADRTDPAQVSLDSWARHVADAILREPDAVTLVGHSRGGGVISRVAELLPARIARLVYVAAYLLPAGASVAAAAREDTDSLVAPNMIAARSGITCALRPEVLRAAFYGECTEAAAARAIERLTPEPLKPLATPLRISDDRFGRVPRAYVECARDRAVTLAAQRRMQRAWPCEPVLTLDSDHSPFLSRPAELASALAGL